MSEWVRGPNVVRPKDGLAMINYVSRGVPARMTAGQINALAPDTVRQQMTFAAVDTTIPLAYGRNRLGGKLFAWGKISSDLVLAYLWCLGEIEEVEAFYLDDAAPAGGITVTHYTGTTSQTVNSNLSSAIGGYTDDLVITTPGGDIGVAYTVVRIPTASMSTIPKSAQAIIKGRKCFDPRTSTTVYTANPALHLYDMLTAPQLGIGLNVVGASAVADRCEELLGGNPRNECHIVFDQPIDAIQQASVLAEYAECLFPVWEGGSIRMVSDAPVTSVTAKYGDHNIIRDSLNLSVTGLENVPTEVEVKYTDTSPGPTPWVPASAIARLPGVDTGAVTRRVSVMHMSGIHDYAQAYRVALTKLRKAQVPAKASWRTLDEAVKDQRGDVVSLAAETAFAELWMRITSVTLDAPGRFTVQAEGYSDQLYPDDVETPGGTFSVPVGVVAILMSGSVPSGWAAFSDADDRLIRGIGTDYAGTTGGSNSITVSGTTESVSSHTGASAFPVFTGAPGTDQGAVVGGPDVAVGGHSHTYSQSVTVSPLRRSYPLIIKTGSPGTLIPHNVMIISSSVLSNPSMARVMSDIAGRLLGAASTVSSAGSASQAVSMTYSSVGNHNHRSIGQRSGSAFGFPAYAYEEAGAHDHAGSPAVTLSPSVKRRQLAAYTGIVDFPCIPGVMFFWPGDIADIPANFALCDGTGGTPDMTDHYVELVTGTPGSSGGDNTANWTGQTETEYHNHQGSSSAHETPTTTALHAADHWHSHTVNGSVAYTPPFIRIPFIMCTGA